MSENLLSVGGLTLERLRNFCLIADAGSLTKVANGNDARMALLSRQLKELETFFGVELRRRQGKGIVLTEAGRRLAALAREQFAGLDDFKRACANKPVEVTIAAGNSVLEWMLLPKTVALRAALPSVSFRLLSQRTGDVVSGLAEQSIDFGIIRADAVREGLRSEPLRPLKNALFVPRSLARGLTAENLRQRLAELPLATSAGGQFRDRLEAEAAKAKWPLHIELSCSSFTQAARAVETGAYAAVLPDVAAVQLAVSKAAQFDLPFLKSYARRLVLCWNPRMAAVREIMEPAKMHLAALLRQ